MNTTRYYYKGWQVLVETDETDTVAETYVYGNHLDEVLLKTNSASYDTYYLHNHQYSPAALVNALGTMVERYEYDVYGKQTIYEPDFSATRTASSYNNVIAFTGQRSDSHDSGDLILIYYKNRYYSVVLGRFVQRDMMGYVDGMSLYEYVRSNPWVYIDPYGYYTIGEFWGDFQIYVQSGGYNWGVPEGVDPDDYRDQITDQFSMQLWDRGQGTASGLSGGLYNPDVIFDMGSYEENQCMAACVGDNFVSTAIPLGINFTPLQNALGLADDPLNGASSSYKNAIGSPSVPLMLEGTIEGLSRWGANDRLTDLIVSNIEFYYPTGMQGLRNTPYNKWANQFNWLTGEIPELRNLWDPKHKTGKLTGGAPSRLGAAANAASIAMYLKGIDNCRKKCFCGDK